MEKYLNFERMFESKPNPEPPGVLPSAYTHRFKEEDELQSLDSEPYLNCHKVQGVLIEDLGLEAVHTFKFKLYLSERVSLAITLCAFHP